MFSFRGAASLQLSGGFGLLSAPFILALTSNRNAIPRVFKDLPAFSPTLDWESRVKHSEPSLQETRSMTLLCALRLMDGPAVH